MQNNPDMKAFVIDYLRSQLPKTYYYHNHEHTLFVMEKVEEIGQAENCSSEELELLQAAALWHDSGYVHKYAGHEEEGCVLARKYLSGYGYTPTAINTICGMIMATRIPQSPRNKLEQILADADLSYLGTAMAGLIADRFFRELQSLDSDLTREAWNRAQIAFLENHRYFTGYCQKKMEPGKTAYLNRLLSRQE